LIKIKEESEKANDDHTLPKTTKIQVTLEDNEEKAFDRYPITIKPKEIKTVIYEVQKPDKKRKGVSEMGEIIDKVKEKMKDAKDTVVDTTKDVAGKTKETVSPQSSDSQSSSSPGSGSRVYEEGRPGTEIGRKDDPLTEYREKEPMTPSKINEHEPTAVSRDPSDQQITEPGQTGTNTAQADEQYRRKGMTKVDTDVISDT
jgi:hypothetical protein